MKPVQIDSSLNNSDWIKVANRKAQQADLEAIRAARRIHDREVQASKKRPPGEEADGPRPNQTHSS